MIRIIALALLSAAMLAFELTLTRLFAVAQFYHFAFMVVSLALLGSGAAGSLLSVWPASGKHPDHLAAGFSLTVLLSYGILNWIPFDSYAIAWDRRQAVYLLVTFVGAAIPFFFTGLATGGLLARFPTQLHRLYGANLIGSALGALGVLPLLGWLGAPLTVFLCAGAGLVAALLFSLMQTGASLVVRSAIGLGAVISIFIALAGPSWVSLELSPYKSLSQALLSMGAVHAVSEWEIAARIDVVQSPTIHIMPGLSQNAMIMQPPEQAGLTRDADNLQPITALTPAEDLTQTLANNTAEAIWRALIPDPADILVLEPGGGWSVLMALAQGADAVTVIESNSQVVDLLQAETFSQGLYADPRVTVHTTESRTFARRTEQTFDVLLVALSDSFHPVTSGAYSLGEDYRYTVEALRDYIALLEPSGILVTTRWLQTPPTESVRVMATILQALSEDGIAQPEEHIAAYRSLRTVTFIASPQPLTSARREVIRSFAQERGYDLVWLSDISPEEVNRFNRLPNPTYYEAFAALLTNPDAAIAAHEFDVRPPTDNRPFFYHYFRWAQTPDVLAGLGKTWQPFGGSGYFVLVVLLALVTLLALVFIIGPLLAKSAGRPAIDAPPGIRWRVLVYFTMLGLAFLFVEIPLAQRFIVYIGQPVTALAAVLFGVLLFSGIGSITAPRWRLDVALGALVVVAVLTALSLPLLLRATLGLPTAARAGLAILSLAPLGLLMGVPFARGTALVENSAPGLIPWAWAINGSASVISGVLAVMVALSWGFTTVLGLGAAAYGVALLALWPLRADATAPPA